MGGQNHIRSRGRAAEHQSSNPDSSGAASPMYTHKLHKESDSKMRNMEYTKLGVWDYYEQRWTSFDFLPGVRYFYRVTRGLEGAPHAIRLIQDTFALAPSLFTLYILCYSLQSILPAVELRYNMQLLDTLQTAIGSQTGDANNIVRIAALRASCHLGQRICTFGILYATQEIELRVQSHFSKHIVNAYARLDLPTFENEAIRSQLESVGVEGSPSIWSYILSIFTVFGTLIELISQSTVLLSIVFEDLDLVRMALLSSVEPILSWRNRSVGFDHVWKASVNNHHYVRMEGLKQSVQNRAHRTDIVAGGLSGFIRLEYQKSRDAAGIYAQSIWEARRFMVARRGMNTSALLVPLLKDTPLLWMALRAIKSPRTAPVSLVQLDLVQRTVSQFIGQLLSMSHLFEVLANNFRLIKNLYDLTDIPNEILDTGIMDESLVDPGSPECGFSVEFQNVRFKYPRTDTYVVQDMSFHIKPGQLCVLVGENGSAKSTTLKLIARLYDAEGCITIGGRDIRTIPLESLRKHIVFLSQDFSIFPLRLRDNIAIGSPNLAGSESQIQQAIRLGGAADFVQSLPQGLDSYLIRPVHDWSSGISSDTEGNQNIDISGGQQQRIALARVFMRINDPNCKLWLFDEPSAALDPAAESALFERLRDMHGSRTIIFSSHRFGGLTPLADLILYFKDGQVVEAGTHIELMRQGDNYARLYNKQARPFQQGVA